MDDLSALLNINLDADFEGASAPKLLLEIEPAYRVFLRNLIDTVLWRSPKPVAISSPPGLFWPDVFVRSPIAWLSFVESILWHMLVVVMVLAVSRRAERQAQFQARNAAQGSYLTYYPLPAFPALGGRRLDAKRGQAGGANSGGPRATRVARERGRGGSSAPPEVNLGDGELPRGLVASASTAPLMPLGATGRARMGLPSGPAVVVVIPPPSFGGGMGAPLLLPASLVVPPAPGITGVSGRRGNGVPNAVAIVPPPTVHGSIGGGAHVTMGYVEVVAPAPQLPGPGSRGGSGVAPALVDRAAMLVVPPSPAVEVDGPGRGRGFGSPSVSGDGYAAVAPAPSLSATGSTGRGRRGSGAGSGSFSGEGSLAGGGSQVVPPAPTLAGVGNEGGGNGRGGSRYGVGSLSGDGVQAVAPAPSLGGMGSGSGRGRGTGTGFGSLMAGRGTGSGFGSLGGSGSQAVAPAPSVGGMGAGSGAGRGAGSGFGSLSGGGGEAVGPAPEVGGMGSGSGVGRGRGAGFGSLGGGGEAVPPAPSVEVAANTGNGHLMAMYEHPNVVQPPPPITDATRGPKEVELPMRLVGIAFALPGTSFFSNYEVFIAERELGSHETELVKLVYEFLPYQRRLSEYHLDYSKVYKLRVRRDQTCDEALNISGAEVAQSGVRNATDPPSEGTKLPCYRTTADEYRKAMK